MSEINAEQAPKPKDPELTPSQAAIKALCDEILALRPQPPEVTFEDVLGTMDPEQIQDRLRQSSLGDLLLQDGETLSAHHSMDGHYPELNLFIGQAKLIAVTVRAWGWEYDKRRINPNGPTTPPYDIIDYPGEKDWLHELDVMLWYSNDEHTASQTITAITGSRNAGTLPKVSRDVASMSYAETGYEGHNQVSRPAKSEEEVLDFVTIAKELFDTRQQR